MGVAVVERDRTAKMRDMYRIVLGEGMGELEAATRRTCGFGEDPAAGGELSQDSGAGERAKLGIRNASMGLDEGDCLGSVCCSEDGFAVSIFGAVEAFPLLTWCMLAVPFPRLPFPELQRPQIGLSGRPWCSSSYHTHCAHRQQSTKT
jgi:hypothetical protein